MIQPMDAPALGAWGEELAAEHLLGLGWQLLARNWRCSRGELDLIALEPTVGRAPIGVVVEVKCRSGRDFGDPLEAITWAKRVRLSQLARQWRSTYPGTLAGLRVDAIGIVKTAGLAPELTHLRGLE